MIQEGEEERSVLWLGGMNKRNHLEISAIGGDRPWKPLLAMTGTLDFKGNER